MVSFLEPSRGILKELAMQSTSLTIKYDAFINQIDLHRFIIKYQYENGKVVTAKRNKVRSLCRLLNYVSRKEGVQYISFLDRGTNHIINMYDYNEAELLNVDVLDVPELIIELEYNKMEKEINNG